MLTEQEPRGTNQEVVHFILKLIWSDEDAIFLFYFCFIFSVLELFHKKVSKFCFGLVFFKARVRELFAEKLPISP